MVSGKSGLYRYYTKQDLWEQVCKHTCPDIYEKNMCGRKHFCIKNNCVIPKIPIIMEIYANKLAAWDEINRGLDDDRR